MERFNEYEISCHHLHKYNAKKISSVKDAFSLHVKLYIHVEATIWYHLMAVGNKQSIAKSMKTLLILLNLNNFKYVTSTVVRVSNKHVYCIMNHK